MAARIEARVLMDIEAERLERFAPVYRRGFVKRYAEHLGLDRAEIAQLLEAMDDTAPAMRTVFPEARPLNRADRWIRATSYLLASLLIGTLVWQFTHEALRLSRGQPAFTTTGEGVAGPVDPATQTGAGAADSTHMNASIAALDVLREQRARSVGAGGEARTTPGETGAGGAPGLALHRLEVVTSGDSWIEITDRAGRYLEQDLVRAGTTRSYQGEPPFRLLFGRASAVRVFLDGEAVDTAPFTLDDVTQMVLRPEAGAADGEAGKSGSG